MANPGKTPLERAIYDFIMEPEPDTAALVETALGVLDTAEDTLRQDGFLTTLFIDDGRAAVRALAQRLADAERRMEGFQYQEAHLENLDAHVARLVRERDAAQARADKAEAALREITEIPLDEDVWWWNRDTPLAPRAMVIARLYFAALTPTEEPHDEG